MVVGYDAVACDLGSDAYSYLFVVALAGVWLIVCFVLIMLLLVVFTYFGLLLFKLFVCVLCFVFVGGLLWFVWCCVCC